MTRRASWAAPCMNRWCAEPPSISPPRFTWSRNSWSSTVGGDGSVILCLDPRRNGPVELGDALGGVTLEPAEDDNAREVRLVAVVEDEIVLGGVVAQVAHVGVCAVRLAVQGQRRRGAGRSSPRRRGRSF